MRRSFLYSAIVATAFASTLPAYANTHVFRSVNDLDVVPISATSFAVIEARGEGPQGMWCAAAEYAERRLGATSRVYISEARGPSRVEPGRNSVVFTIDPSTLSQGPFQSITIGTSQVGLGLPVAHARQFCRKEDFDISLNLPGRD
ncbi:hypothetical protein [Sulfitobacter guttiformis]|uniref:Uncharacterized protein n=1 Tax=Sulfitobacter guttiformis TaxID=74349 RepID=A0A420DNM7_9RHOB|nr:hypothetical protein [Sulfitobacter guttiformis]KIN73169.1 hypothetical protein Z949_2354 [Sulfitobacter guttiformis KCTC 32187]RKE95851.1 hypothetical protein C8N30_0395 [Sulfitobacter guttiformis]